MGARMCLAAALALTQSAFTTRDRSVGAGAGFKPKSSFFTGTMRAQSTTDETKQSVLKSHVGSVHRDTFSGSPLKTGLVIIQIRRDVINQHHREPCGGPSERSACPRVSVRE